MNKRILLISLGCDKNLVDSEMMLGQLAGKGYTFTDDEDEAEIAVVNSCCFINDAKEESINTILQLAERKKEGQRSRKWTLSLGPRLLTASRRLWKK